MFDETIEEAQKLSRKLKVLFSKQSDEWRTPQWLFDYFNEQYKFTLDAAATKDNALCKEYFTKEDSAFSHGWGHQKVWLNPPHSLLFGFLQKAMEEAQKQGTTVVCLIPARTDTGAWHSTVWKASTVYLIKGRLCFLGEDGQPRRDKHGRPMGAPFPSAVVVFNPRLRRHPPQFLPLWQPIKKGVVYAPLVSEV